MLPIKAGLAWQVKGGLLSETSGGFLLFPNLQNKYSVLLIILNYVLHSVHSIDKITEKKNTFQVKKKSLFTIISKSKILISRLKIFVQLSIEWVLYINER